MSEIEFSSDIDVKLIRSMASDDTVVQAAQVSVKGENNPETDSPRLISYLMSSRHGCYDDKTEVLTNKGWLKFKDLYGDETFATLNIKTSEIEYQTAERFIEKKYKGSMVSIKTQQVDLLVTPDHRMLGEARTNKGWGSHLKTFPASDLLLRSHRVRSGGGYLDGISIEPIWAELLGFVIADGHVSPYNVEFHLRRDRKIKWLNSRFDLPKRDDRYSLSSKRIPQYIWELMKDTYTDDGDRQIPRQVLESWNGDSIAFLLEGYLEGDGSLTHSGSFVMSTVSRQLADDLQEAGVLSGGSIQLSRIQYERSSAYGNRPIYHLRALSLRHSQPRIGWTTKNRQEEVKLQDYSGKIFCVTVPNGTLYVRRNGKALWCGNSPFEHNAFQFFIAAPIFVFREWHRHRIASINEMSGRYSVLKPRFYTPGPDRKMINIGTSARPEMAPGSDKQRQLMLDTDQDICYAAWQAYQKRLEAGISNELARTILPLSVYSEMYWTVNARSLMNFLSLRIDSEDSLVRSRPQWEIQMGAEKMERYFAELMPATHAAFVKNGRVAP